jgi:hypothetical protein
MEYAEKYATPIAGKLGQHIRRSNDFKDIFFVRWGRIRFNAFWGEELNIKVILKVYRNDTCEHFIVDTDPYEINSWNNHKRKTRDFFVHPYPIKNDPVNCVKFSYVVHLHGRSIPSQHEYIFMDGADFANSQVVTRRITTDYATPNHYRTHELDADQLQRDVDWHNSHFSSLNLVPKFTKGQVHHPYHPRQYIHEQINWVIGRQYDQPHRQHTIKVSVDCIDDTDFINHLIYAHGRGVKVQCIVDWRKMTLTNSDNYAKLKKSGIELLGVFCTPKHPLIEVAPDMHTKFIIFDDERAITGSFNITFDRWWANWESGMTFNSVGVARLLDNIFQSIRGGMIQKYGIDPHSRFNLLYTFGRTHTLSGNYYRPHQAILSEIHRAKHSIKLCLFLMGEMQGEHNDSVVDALIAAHWRGVHVQLILNGHLARQGDPGQKVTMAEELNRPLLPAVQRLRDAGVNVILAYGEVDHEVPYCPIHAKYCIIDEHIVLDGSFNWYNTSTFSHDLLIVAADAKVAEPYLFEFNQILHKFRLFT